MTLPQLLLLILGATIFFAIGWNAAVAKHRAGRRSLEGHVADLEVQVAAFTAERARDPQRAWTNTGALYAIGQIEQTIAHIKNDLANRTSRESP